MPIPIQNPGRSRWIAALLLLGALFFSCEQPGGLTNPEKDPDEKDPQESLGYTVSANGENGVESSTALTFIFDDAVPDLADSHISLTNGTGAVTPGTLTGGDKTWTLPITVGQAGDITVQVVKEGIATGEKTVTVYLQGTTTVLSWTVTANGTADTETTTALTLTLSGAVSGLTGDHIDLSPGTGRASLVDLSGSGQNWLMLIAVEQAGTLSVSITHESIENGPKSVTVHKGAEIPPPEKVGITILSPPDTTYYGRNMAFDTTGLEVAFLYSDGSTEVIPVGGYTVGEPNMSRYTTQTVTVRAGGYEASFTIDVVNTDKVLLSLMVNGPTNKVQALGKEFDKTGLVVTGHFSDGSEKDLSNLAALVGYDKFRRGPQAVSVKVNGKTASLSGITTRIGEEAYLEIYTGFGIKTTFIKGETLTAEKANLMFEFKPVNDGYLAGIRNLSLENGGLLPEDFSALVASYNPQQPGKQTLSIILDDRPFTVDFYVVDTEPAAWFDFGYMRHAGDPAGQGPGAGKYYAQPNETLVIAPVRYLIGYNEDNSDAGVTYNWTVSGNVDYTTSRAGELLHITPQAVGTYTISVSVSGRNFITGSAITKTAQAELVCYTNSLPAGAFTSPLKNFGPGQMCEGGTGYGWSLGSVGGYEVWAVEPRASYDIPGNPLTGWREPGVVWMQEDMNGNGLPDEMWYELPGGDETHPIRKNQITRRYAITYFKTNDHGTTNEYGQKIREVYWVDSRGRAGMIPGGFPTPWGVIGDRVTYTGTLLRDDGEIFSPNYNMADLDGYVDCTGNIAFPVSRAVRSDGTPANLSAVKFLRVQTSLFRYGDIFGDVSTEIPWADFLPDQTGGFPMP
ncbi:MAG: bacterial Ig-like domain-containing protein [Treponema sp.]|nr:bacterial Ig-like domain-containing protein [Treponema sp.]